MRAWEEEGPRAENLRRRQTGKDAPIGEVRIAEGTSLKIP